MRLAQLGHRSHFPTGKAIGSCGACTAPAHRASAGEIHKKQGLSEPASTPVTASPSLAPDPASAPRPKPKLRVSWPLKWFVLFMSLGLVGTTLLGITMAFKYRRGVRLILGLLVAGTLLPIALLYF